MGAKLKLVTPPWLIKASELIELYKEGSDLTDDELHVLNDTALEHGQILDNVAHMGWFVRAVAENLRALS